MMGVRWEFVRPLLRQGVLGAALVSIVMLGTFGIFVLPTLLLVDNVIYPTRLELVDESGRLAPHVAAHLPSLASLDLARGGRAADEDIAVVLARVRTGDVEGALWVDEITEVDGSARWVANRRPDDATLLAMQGLAAAAARSRLGDEAGIPGWTLAPATGERVVVKRVDGEPVGEAQRAWGLLFWPLEAGLWVMAVAPAVLGFCSFLVIYGWLALLVNPVDEAVRHRRELHALHAGAKWTLETTSGVATAWGLLGVLVPGMVMAPVVMVAASLDNTHEARWTVLGAAIAVGSTTGVAVAVPRTIGPITDHLAGPGWFNFLGRLSPLAYMIGFAVGAVSLAGGVPALAMVSVPGLGALWGWVALFDLTPLVVTVLAANTALTLWTCHRALHHLVRVRDVMGDLDVWIDDHLPRFLAVGRDED